MRRPQLSLTDLLVWFMVLPASAGAAFEAARQATDDNARATVAWILASGALLGGAIGFTRGRSVVKSALWGMLIWPTIAMLTFVAAILYAGSR